MVDRRAGGPAVRAAGHHGRRAAAAPAAAAPRAVTSASSGELGLRHGRDGALAVRPAGAGGRAALRRARRLRPDRDVDGRPAVPVPRFLGPGETLRRITEADVVITHGGNTVRLAQRAGKVPIAVAREAARGEMRNDHQVTYLAEERAGGRVGVLAGDRPALAAAVADHPGVQAPARHRGRAAAAGGPGPAGRAARRGAGAGRRPVRPAPAAPVRVGLGAARRPHRPAPRPGRRRRRVHHRAARAPSWTWWPSTRTRTTCASCGRRPGLPLVRVGTGAAVRDRRVRLGQCAGRAGARRRRGQHAGRAAPGAAAGRPARAHRAGPARVLRARPGQRQAPVPRLHRAVYQRRFGRAEYDRRFVDAATACAATWPGTGRSTPTTGRRRCWPLAATSGSSRRRGTAPDLLAAACRSRAALPAACPSAGRAAAADAGVPPGQPVPHRDPALTRAQLRSPCSTGRARRRGRGAPARAGRHELVAAATNRPVPAAASANSARPDGERNSTYTGPVRSSGDGRMRTSRRRPGPSGRPRPASGRRSTRSDRGRERWGSRGAPRTGRAGRTERWPKTSALGIEGTQCHRRRTSDPRPVIRSPRA